MSRGVMLPARKLAVGYFEKCKDTEHAFTGENLRN